jgi:hypothetical protein
MTQGAPVRARARGSDAPLIADTVPGVPPGGDDGGICGGAGRWTYFLAGRIEETAP